MRQTTSGRWEAVNYGGFFVFDKRWKAWAYEYLGVIFR